MATVDPRCGHGPAMTQQKAGIGQQRTSKRQGKTEELGDL